jgi:peptide/nickel transport system substrate-binding protein
MLYWRKLRMRNLAVPLLSALIGLGSTTAHASQLLLLAEDVPAGLDIDGPSIAIPATQEGMVQFLEPLVDYVPKGLDSDGVVVPDFSKLRGRLLESWSYDPASLTWTLHLRHGVKSCAGNTFTADDVIYTWQRSKSVSGAVPNGWFLLNMASVANFSTDVFSKDPAVSGPARKLGDEVKKIDDYTLTIRQAQPNPLFMVNMAVVISQSIYDKTDMEKHATAADPWSHDYANNVNAPSFGPYCLSKWVKNDEMVFQANPNYYRGKAAIDRVVMKRVPQAANRLVILRSGEAQIIQGMTAHQYDSLKTQKGVTVGGVYGNEGLFIVMNFKTKPFDNIKLRQAIADAIPYSRIIDVGFSGEAKQWQSVVPPTYPSYVASTDYSYDPAKAKQLLADAGYPGGQGLEKYADAFKLTYVAEKEATLGPIVNAISTSLQQVGVPVTLNPMPETEYGDHQIVKKDLAFAVNDQEKPIGVDTGYAMQLFFVSMKAGGLNNMENYANPDVDALWAKAKLEIDVTKRNDELAQMQSMLMRDVAWLPVVTFKTQWAYTDKLKGVSWVPDNSLRFYDLHY